jgi:hypothetical protein
VKNGPSARSLWLVIAPSLSSSAAALAGAAKLAIAAGNAIARQITPIRADSFITASSQMMLQLWQVAMNRE